MQLIVFFFMPKVISPSVPLAIYFGNPYGPQKSVQIGRHCELLSSSPTLQYPSLSNVSLRNLPHVNSPSSKVVLVFHTMLSFNTIQVHIFILFLSLPGLFTLKFPVFSCFLIFLTSKLVK